MNTLLIICTAISLSIAVPIPEDAQAKILSYTNESDGLGNYEFSFETSDGIFRKESGRLVNVGQPDEHLEVQGAYTYTDPDGKLVEVEYTADQNGYVIKGGLPGPLVPILDSIPSSAVATLLG